MPAKYFKCPNGSSLAINECLNQCQMSQRCMFLPTLRAVAKSLDRGLAEPTVTELITGTRETYLKKTTDYAVMCRDSGLRIAGERGINKTIYLIQINTISDRWIKRYMDYKAQAIKLALEKEEMPTICTIKERWNNRKCLDYCNVANDCPYGHVLKRTREKHIEKVS